MNIPEVCIRRPVMTTLVMAGIVLFGIMAYRTLPVAELPNVDFPTVEVSARLPGANPETMASAVATPLENAFSKIAGVRAMTSVSSMGNTRVTLEFELERNIDAAALDVQSAISGAVRQLPQEISEPPSFRKVNPADFPIYFLSLRSRSLPVSQVNDYAENVISQRLSTIDGVAQMQIWGQQKYAVRIQVNPDALVTRGIGFDEIEREVKKGNSNQPVGSLSGPSQEVSIKTTGKIIDAAGYNNLIVAYRNGAPVRLNEIGRAVDSVENDKASSWFSEPDSKELSQGLMMVIYRQPGSNTVKIVDDINRVLPQLRLQVPESIEIRTLYDRSVSIREGIHDVEFTLMLAGGLVIMVIFLFLRSISATIIASIALPISIIGTFALMLAMGFSLNNLSLMALTLAVGFVVDDAIVMLENIIRHKERGLPTLEAALLGSREIGFTIVSMTLSLIAVFIPIIFMKGMIGRLLHEFALTISAAILVSGVVSLTLTPMMCSRFISDKTHGHGAKHGWLFRTSEKFFDGMLWLYDVTLRWCLRNHFVVFLSFLATLVLTVMLYGKVQKDFLPEEDTGRLLARTEAGQDASYEQLLKYQHEVAKIATQNPNVAEVMSRAGGSGPSSVNNEGFLFFRMKDPKTRPQKDIRLIVQDLRRSLNTIPGIRVYVINPPLIRVGGRISNAAYQYTLQDVDLDTLYRWADTMRSEIGKLPGFQDVVSDLKISSPSLTVSIDRDRASTLGVSAEQIEGVLASAYGSRRISTIYTSSSQYAVIIEVDPAFQENVASLSKLYVRASGGKLVPLDAVTTVKRGVSPLTVAHQGQLPAVTISFNLAPDVSLGTAIDRIRALERTMQMPATVSTSFAGTAQVFESSLQGMGLLLLLAIVVVYIVLGILYESFIHPLTILSGLPAAGVGALATLLWYDLPLTLYAFVGIVMLVGIVKKNAIMMIDFALSAQREENKAPADAIYEACIIRFRPIMMTTLAALMGAIPIAIGYGQGGEARAPLGLTVVGGLLVSQVITLYLTPVVYLYLDKLQNLGVRQQAPIPQLKPAVPAGNPSPAAAAPVQEELPLPTPATGTGGKLRPAE